MNPKRRDIRYTEKRAGEGRRLDCATYNGCLTVAQRGKWINFTCVECGDYAQQSRENLRKDLEGMAALFREIRKHNYLPGPGLLPLDDLD